MTYQELLNRKRVRALDFGIEPKDTSAALFEFQKRAVEFAIRKGRAALFLDTGLGKTICQVEWARQIPGDKLILAPPAVAPQTVREAAQRLGVEIHHSRDGSVNGPITITNYERLHLFDANRFSGIVLDESSILKGFMGKTTERLIQSFRSHPHRLACTATPSPNDHTELGTHAEFLGVMDRGGMLARWFVNDTANTGDWRLKGHAHDSFWQWVSTWAACASKPSDLGGDDSAFELPPLTTRLSVVDSPARMDVDQGLLFGHAELSATNIHRDKRATMEGRVAASADLANTGDHCIIWCETNDESSALAKAINDCVDVVGSDDPDEKEAKLDAFSRGDVRAIVTKPSIAGFGLNWQHCSHVVFASLSYSYEQFYQAVRRTWRFGQKRPVHVDVVIADSEQGIWRAIKAKMDSHDEMKSAMRKASAIN